MINSIFWTGSKTAWPTVLTDRLFNYACNVVRLKIINHYAFSSSIEPSDVNGYSGCLPDWSSSPSLVTSVMSIFSQCPFQSCSTTTNDAYVKLDFLFYTQYIAQIQFKSGVGFPSIFTTRNERRLAPSMTCAQWGGDTNFRLKLPNRAHRWTP